MGAFERFGQTMLISLNYIFKTVVDDFVEILCTMKIHLRNVASYTYGSRTFKDLDNIRLKPNGGIIYQVLGIQLTSMTKNWTGDGLYKGDNILYQRME